MAPLKTHEEEWELESGTQWLVIRLDKEVGEGRLVIPQPRGREEAGRSEWHRCRNRIKYQLP